MKLAVALFIAAGHASFAFAQQPAAPAPASVGAGGDKIPPSVTGIKGPESMTSKAEIVQLLKDSFASGHHAAAALTAENSLDMVSGPGGGKVPRVFGLTFATVHAFDEYGQMEEYLRMNGIVPPASQPK